MNNLPENLQKLIGKTVRILPHNSSFPGCSRISGEYGKIVGIRKNAHRLYSHVASIRMYNCICSQPFDNQSCNGYPFNAETLESPYFVFRNNQCFNCNDDLDEKEVVIQHMGFTVSFCPGCFRSVAGSYYSEMLSLPKENEQ